MKEAKFFRGFLMIVSVWKLLFSITANANDAIEECNPDLDTSWTPIDATHLPIEYQTASLGKPTKEFADIPLGAACCLEGEAAI